MSKITNDGITRSGTGCLIVGVEGLRKKVIDNIIKVAK